MEYASGLQFASAVGEISVINLMLSADNALVIAMCCNSLPPTEARTAVAVGTAGAIALRCLLTAISGLLLEIPYLKIFAAVALAAIAVNLMVANDRNDRPGEEAARPPGEDDAPGGLARGMKSALWSAVATSIAADLFMSLDNIVALAAVAQGNAWLLIFGLLLSIPLLAFGGLLVVGLLRRHPMLVETGGAVLGWIAGKIALADPAIASWAQRDAPALSIVLPLLGVVLVLWESRILRRALRRRNSPRAGTQAALAMLERSRTPPP
ncbi:MAG TPA: YjbE family putative metal transport protein [Acetobacteraceae bacterium]|nr:YjbE family putative metal transport protein [Acetobacteraceae bacterium]